MLLSTIYSSIVIQDNVAVPNEIEYFHFLQLYFCFPTSFI